VAKKFTLAGFGENEYSLAFYVYDSGVIPIKQEGHTTSGEYDPNITRYSRIFSYIGSWIGEGNKEQFLDSVFDRDTLESRYDTGYKLTGEISWNQVSPPVAIFNCMLYFKKTSANRNDLPEPNVGR